MLQNLYFVSHREHPSFRGECLNKLTRAGLLNGLCIFQSALTKAYPWLLKTRPVGQTLCTARRHHLLRLQLAGEGTVYMHITYIFADDSCLYKLSDNSNRHALSYSVCTSPAASVCRSQEPTVTWQDLSAAVLQAGEEELLVVPKGTNPALVAMTTEEGTAKST